MIESTNKHAIRAFEGLSRSLALDADSLGGALRIRAGDYPRVSLHRLASASSAALAALGCGVAAIWRLRGGAAQNVKVDSARALQALRCHTYSRKNGRQLPIEKGPLSGYHRCADGRWICIYASHVLGDFLDAALGVLGCQHDATSIAAAVGSWRGEELEQALNERRVPAALVRSEAEWAAHPQGQWLAARPVVEIERMAASPPEALPRAPRPLSGLRVLDVTLALCGPALSRALAEQGAQVLRVAAPHCSDPEAILIDTGFGKRSTYLDLGRREDSARAQSLAGGADVVVQSFRPGALERCGLGAELLAQLRPGLIYVSVSGYGSGGPWAARGAYEALGQAVAGISDAESDQGRPRSVRTGTLNDYLAAYLGAAGVMAALLRRSREGGSYHVKVSLARTSMWVRELGTIPEARAYLGVDYAEPVAPELIQVDSPFGAITALAPPIRYSVTPGYWALPPSPLGSSPASWEPQGSA
jgi:crotonobetainyl-CoA:carnitine CoA-transferase CaiB-like acyl-CoA transferase